MEPSSRSFFSHAEPSIVTVGDLILTLSPFFATVTLPLETGTPPATPKSPGPAAGARARIALVARLPIVRWSAITRAGLSAPSRAGPAPTAAGVAATGAAGDGAATTSCSCSTRGPYR